MNQIITVPLDVSDTDLSLLLSSGFIPIRTEFPSAVKIILPGSEVLTSDLLMAALHGLCRSANSTAERSDMVLELRRRLTLREKKEAEPE